MKHDLIPPRFLFRFEMPLQYCKTLWKEHGFELDESHRLLNLAQLDGEYAPADVRAGWNELGLFFTLHMVGKQQAPWCRESQMDDSDGLHLWIDTRATHNIHRASRFCHRFAFLPGGTGRKYEDPVADQLIINRAREHANPIRPQQLRVLVDQQVDGYLLKAYIPADALTGYEPAEYPRLGFTYAVVDRERGIQTFSVGVGLPYEEDPSTWATLEMVK